METNERPSRRYGLYLIILGVSAIILGLAISLCWGLIMFFISHWGLFLGWFIPAGLIVLAGFCFLAYGVIRDDLEGKTE